MMQPQPLLSLDRVARVYDSGDAQVRALDGVSLAIWPGEFVAIMGQSGSGKTTLMNILGCLDRPSGGTYKVSGRDVAGLTSDELAALRRETFGFVFQRYNLLATASAAENVEIPAVYAGLGRRERMTRARGLLSRLGLGQRLDHRPSQLSGGQQQRVAIARALVNDPPIILADEPTGALDSKSGQDVMALLKSLNAEGRTIILITHDEKVASHAARVIHISDGKIVNANAAHGIPAMTVQKRSKISAGADMMTDVMEAGKTALRSLHANLFRTALTLLGIVIGVAAVIAMLAIGNGSKQKVLDQISAMGTNLLSIRPGMPGFRGAGDIATLVMDDAEAIARVANVAAVLPERSGRVTLRYGSTDYATTVRGQGAAFPQVQNWEMDKGMFFTERDVAQRAPVAVLGQTTLKTLFPFDDDPVGKYVLVQNIPFRIIGTLKAKGASTFGDQDDAAFVPVTTAMTRLFGQDYLSSVTVLVDDVDRIDQTQDEITALLTQRHRGVEDFRIRNMASILETATATQNTLTILLATVAAISLIVGGIGVMNIMLVSVTERTREIGIRIATGARRRDIMLQFNTESLVVCIIGGLMGVAFGFIAGWVATLFDVAVVFSFWPALLAFSCAVATGLVFGWLPARKAAALDPVVALSSE